jgi:hypothetical protein
MIARTRKTKTSSNQDALAAFVQKKVEIDAMLARLQALSDDHFNYSPEEIRWDHVGTLGYYAELSSGSPTAPSTRATTPNSRSDLPPTPRAAPAAGARARRRAIMLSGDGDDPMTTTDLSKKQLATILSALDDAPRSPAKKGDALRAIGRSAQRFGLTPDDVLAAAPGLLDGRMSPADFRVELQDQGGAPDPVTDAPQGAPDAQDDGTAVQGSRRPSPRPHRPPRSPQARHRLRSLPPTPRPPRRPSAGRPRRRRPARRRPSPPRLPPATSLRPAPAPSRPA